jgi:hypothetical protein
MKKMNPIAEAKRWKNELKQAKRDCLIFDHETGIVTRTYTKGRIRNDVGHVNGNGYKIIRVDKKMYQLHRLIWEDAHGPIAEGLCIDHIDGDKLNNRLSNLRLVTHKQNMENLHKANKTNQCGVKGVGAYRGKYRARIRSNNQPYELGIFATIELAQQAYIMAARRLHTHNPVTSESAQA